MSADAGIHGRLIARQSDAELERKAKKARERANLWTQEELDAADRRAERIMEGQAKCGAG